MECNSCHTDNPSAFRFCGTCGLMLAARRCDGCGFSTPMAFAFCGSCGTAYEPGRGNPGEERKLATVMFADVVGFTSMSEDNDPELLARLVDTAFRRLSDIVVSHGGTVDKYIGDSVMAVFGVPLSHDDDAERAVAAALAIQVADMELGFSIGVNTGEVMVMAMGGGSVTVMGDVVNVAARLQKEASRGQVLVGPVTVELTQNRVAYRDCSALELRGKRLPVDVREAVAVRVTPVLPDSIATQLVGHEEELEFLLSQWRRVRSIRRAGVVLLTGDPGIGKTRLLDELVAMVGEQAFVVRSVYPPYGGSGGVRVGGDLVHQLGPSADEAVQARVRSLAGDIDHSLVGIDPVALRQEQLWALRRLAEDRSRQHPVLLLIEDVHMADTSIELLTSVVARLVDLPVLAVFAGRPEGRWLGSFPTASTVRLGPLSATETVTLAQLWHPGQAPDETITKLSGGNPLFLRELQAFESDQRAAGVPLRRLPVSLRAVLAARLDGLGAGERSVLQDLAVIGDLATAGQLVALGGATTSEAITSLTNAGMVRHRPDGALHITEPLLREVAYETLPLQVRVERHLRVAELSLTQDERARHLERASSHAPDDEVLRTLAAGALAVAGTQALDAARPLDAVSLLRRAVTMGYRDPVNLLRLAELYNGRDRAEALVVLDLIPDISTNQRLDAERTLVLANALVDHDSDAAMMAFDDAAQRWQAVGDGVKEGWSHSNKAVALFLRGDMYEADGELLAGLELFRREGHRAGEMAAVSFRAMVRPDHPDVETWMHENLSYSLELGDRSRHLGALVSLSWHHFLKSRLGGPVQTGEANLWTDEAISLSTELGQSSTLLQMLCLRANLARMAGRLGVARDTVARARRMGALESAGERALLQAINASIESGVAFEPYTETDVFTSIASVVQMESALLEGRFHEIVDKDLQPLRLNLGRHEALVGFVPAAAGLASLGLYDDATRMAAQAAGAADRAGARTAAVAARAVLAECAARTGDVVAALALLPAPDDEDVPGGLAGALVKRARAILGDDQALMALRADADVLRAPGLLVGLRA